MNDGLIWQRWSRQSPLRFFPGYPSSSPVDGRTSDGSAMYSKRRWCRYSSQVCSVASGHDGPSRPRAEFFVVAALVGLGSADLDHQPIGVHLDDPQLPEVQQRRPVDLKAALWEDRR